MWSWRTSSDENFVDYDISHNTLYPSHDNVANAGVAFGLYFMFVHFYVWEWLSILLVMIFTGIWQVKNGLVPSVDSAGDNRYFGGWGYSWKSQVYGAGGVLVAFLLDVMWPPAIQPAKNGESFSELEGDEDMSF